MATTFNVQTAGDEAIYCKFPGATGKPTPTSGRSISLPDGFKELRYIKDSTGKVIWAHKWRLTAKAGTGGTVSCSPAGARVKNGQTITVTATPDGTYKFTGWSDGSTTNPRSFTMTNHASITANFGSNTYTIIFKNYNASTSSAGTTLKTDQLEAGATPTPPSPLPTTPDSPVAGKTYTFTGWSPAVSKVTGHQTYVAQYSSGESTVTVTFKDYDGSELKTSTVNYGTAATDVPKPDDPSRTGYKFTGWGNPDPASAVNASGQVIANCVYIAQYSFDPIIFDGDVDTGTTEYTRTVEAGTYRVTIVGAGGGTFECHSGEYIAGYGTITNSYKGRGSGGSGAMMIGTFTLTSADTLKIKQGPQAVSSYVKSSTSTSTLNIIAKAGTSASSAGTTKISAGSKGTVSGSTKTGLTLESSADGNNGAQEVCHKVSWAGGIPYGDASYPKNVAPGGYASTSYPYGGGKGWSNNSLTKLTQRGYVKIVRIS